MAALSEQVWANKTAFVTTLAGAIAYVGLVKGLAAVRIMNSTSARKLMHIGTGLIYMLHWPLYKSNSAAPYMCASVPALITMQFLLVGIGLVQDRALVAGSTRHGQRTELLRGPLSYGLVHVLVTLLYWRNHPAGVIALAVLCAGDGMAEVVGRWLGAPASHRLPHNRQKSYAGSLAFWLFGAAASIMMLHYFQSHGYFMDLPMQRLVRNAAACSLAGSIIESLPIADWDNLTITAAVLLLSNWLR